MTPALAPFLAFSPALRQQGFPAAPEQAASFLASVGLLGPRSLADIRRAAHAVFGPQPERQEAFDAVFDAIFLGRAFAVPSEGRPEDLPQSYDAGDLGLLPEPEEDEPSGADATPAERLFARALSTGDEGQMLRAFARAVPDSLPRRRSRRTLRGKGRMADPARAFRQMLRKDGEITTLPTRRRRTRQRRVLMLIDISGSMKAGTDGALRLAHALARAGERVEVFTLGTRLTRVTRALRHANRDQALALASGLVADWDGGTRLGDALLSFLAVPRFASFARGALTVIVSDGLERGGYEKLTDAIRKTDALSWSILWLSPLAADPDYRPETGAMRAILPHLDHLGDGSTPTTLAREILAFAKGAR